MWYLLPSRIPVGARCISTLLLKATAPIRWLSLQPQPQPQPALGSSYRSFSLSFRWRGGGGWLSNIPSPMVPHHPSWVPGPLPNTFVNSLFFKLSSITVYSLPKPCLLGQHCGSCLYEFPRVTPLCSPQQLLAHRGYLVSICRRKKGNKARTTRLELTFYASQKKKQLYELWFCNQ